MASSLDLLDHFKQDAQFKQDADTSAEYTLHISYRRNRRLSSGREKVETRWYRREMLVEGAFGKVWLEEKYDGSASGGKRAVKTISKDQMRLYKIDYKKE